MKINMILSFLRRTALFIATMFAFFVSANAGALAQSICKVSTKHLNSNINFATIGLGIFCNNWLRYFNNNLYLSLGYGDSEIRY
jgi:hypothetical protein